MSSAELRSVFSQVVAVRGAVTKSLTSVRHLVDQQTQDFSASVEKAKKLVRQLLFQSGFLSLTAAAFLPLILGSA